MKRRRRVVFAGVWLAFGSILAVAYYAPIYLLRDATADARACLLRYTAPREAELPRCEELAAAFDFPARFPWTAKAAADRREELGARIAIADYVDAAVGSPDPEALIARGPTMDEWAERVRTGSGRLVLEELGPATAAPDRGHWAQALGQRRVLLSGYRDWGRWDVRKAALDAALIEGNLELATTIAAHYADRAPLEGDLKAMVGAILCLGDRPAEGLPLLQEVVASRVDGRHESIARHFGEVFAVALACAARAKQPLPMLPEERAAGIADAIEMRAVQRIRIATTAREGEAVERALDLATLLLTSQPRPEGLGLWPQTSGARPALVAAVLAADTKATTTGLIDLIEPRGEAEPGWAADPRWTATLVWRQPASLLAPVVDEDVLGRAAQRLDEMRAARELSDADRERLGRVAADLWTRLGVREGAAGSAERAEASLRKAAKAGDWELAHSELAIAVMWRLGGDPSRAQAALDVAATGEPSGPEAGAVKAARAIERGEILAALGRRAEAARQAADAEKAAARAEDPFLHAHAQWAKVALLERPSDAGGDDGTGPTAGPAWVGYADESARWLGREPALLARSLDAWSAALAAGPQTQLAFRYALLARRGDVPPVTVAYLFAATRLLGVEAPAAARERRAAIETWLDAVTAYATRAPSLRAYAWSRAEAARWRGDAESAAAWETRLKALRELASDPARIEIATYLGI